MEVDRDPGVGPYPQGCPESPAEISVLWFTPLKRAGRGHAAVREMDTRGSCGLTRPRPQPNSYLRSREHALPHPPALWWPPQEPTGQHIYEGPSQVCLRTSPTPTPLGQVRVAIAADGFQSPPRFTSIYCLLNLNPLSPPILRATPYQMLKAQLRHFLCKGFPPLGASPHTPTS